MIQGSGRPTKYTTADGKRVPGVTTIVSRYKDSGGLIHWAYQCGVDGIDYRAKRDDAADAGHAAHAAIEAEIHGQPAPTCPPEHAAAVASCVEAFRGWRDQTRLEILETEVPLVSEQYRFGGCFDALARVAGKLVLLDWKSSNRVYADYLAQMGGYDVLLAERGLARALGRVVRVTDLDAADPPAGVEGVQLLRFGKEHGDFHAHSWPRSVLDIGRDAFLLMRRLYELDAPLKRAVG